MNERVERIFVAILLCAALALTFANASVRAKADAPREDAVAASMEKLSRLDPGAPLARLLGAWVVLSLGAAAFATHRLGGRLLRKEPLEDPLAAPPPWSLVDFTLVFVLALTCQSAASTRFRPLVVLEDGRTLEVAATRSSIVFGVTVPVPGANGESAAIVHSGDELVFRVPRVHEAAPHVFLNGERVVDQERPFRRGDRFDVGGLRGALHGPDPIEYLAVVGLCQLFAPLFVVAAVLLRGASPRELGLRGFTAREALRGAVGYFAMVPGTFAFMFLAQALCRALGVPMTEHPLLKTLQRENDPRALWMLLLVAGVLAPISEEILFRGFLLRALRRPIPSRAAAVLAASLLFGAVHPGLSSLLPIMWVGSVFALLFTTSKDRSLLSAMVCHALFNCVNIGVEWGLLRSV